MDSEEIGSFLVNLLASVKSHDLNEDIYDVLRHGFHSVTFKKKLKCLNLSDFSTLLEFLIKKSGPKELSVEFIQRWAKELADVFEEIKNNDEMDICEAFQEAEEAIMDKKETEASRFYDKVFWALIFMDPQEPNTRLKNPMHVCKFLPKFNSTQVDVKIPTQSCVKDQLFDSDLSEEVITKCLKYEFQSLEYCHDCESIIDNFSSFYFFKYLLRRLHLSKEQDNFILFITHWMKTYKENNVEGFYFYSEQILFKEVLIKKLENLDINNSQKLMAYLKRVQDNMDFDSSFQQMTSDHLEDLEWVMDEFEKANSEEICPHESTRIIVDQNEGRKIVDGVFYIPDLATALKISKDGDKIFVKAGTYQLNGAKYWEMKRAITLQGEGPENTCIEGPWVTNSRVILKNLKLEIGDEEDDTDSFYVMPSSCAAFEYCHFISPSNTVLSVLNDARVYFNSCFLDGIGDSARFMSLCHNSEAEVYNIYCKNFFSFCSVIQPSETLDLKLKMVNCYIEDVQDAVKIMVHPVSQSEIEIDRVKLELDILDPECSCSGIEINAGQKVELKNVVIEATHADYTGFSIQNVDQVLIKNVYMTGNQELVEETSIGKGISLMNNENTFLRNCHLQCLRIGLEIVDSGMQKRTVKICDLTTEKCSIGSCLQNQGNQELQVLLGHVQATTCYYGLMLDLDQAKDVFLHEIKFENVPKAILKKKNLKNLRILGALEYSYPMMGELQVNELSENELDEKLRQQLYIEFCSKEKIPFRVAYEHQDFIVISRNREEKSYYS